MAESGREYPLSALSVQQRIRPGRLEQVKTGAQNLFIAFLAPADFEMGRLMSALHQITGRHSQTRTRYPCWEGSQPPIVADWASPVVHSEYVVDAPPLERAHELLQTLSNWLFADICLDVGCQIEGRLLRASDYSLVVLRTPHFVSDAFSMDVIYRELLAHLEGQPIVGAGLPPDMVNYDNYVREQAAAITTGGWDETLTRLSDRYRSSPDFAFPDVYRGGEEEDVQVSSLFRVGAQQNAHIQELAKRAGCPAETVVLSMMATACASWSGQERFLLPIMYHGRSTAADHLMVGFFVTELLLPIVVDHSLPFVEKTKQIFEIWKDVARFGGVPAYMAAAQVRYEGQSVIATNLMTNFGASKSDYEPPEQRSPQRFSRVTEVRRPLMTSKRKGIYIQISGNTHGLSGDLFLQGGAINAAGVARFREIFAELLAFEGAGA